MIQMGDDVRCQNPKCKALLAGRLDGELTIKCRKCGLEQTIIIRAKTAQDSAVVRSQDAQRTTPAHR